MNLYENIFIGRQDLSQQQIEALGVSLGLFVEQNGGEVVRSEYCGFRDLAYTIKKNRKGHYYIMQMKASGPTVAELERIMRINEDVIRHLVIKVEEFDDRDNLISQIKTFSDDNSTRDAGYRSQNKSQVNASEDVDQLTESKTVVEEITVEA